MEQKLGKSQISPTFRWLEHYYPENFLDSERFKMGEERWSSDVTCCQEELRNMANFRALFQLQRIVLEAHF